MAKLSVDQVLLKARSYVKKGEIEEAQKLYQMVLQAFPENKRAQQGLAAVGKSKQTIDVQGPPPETVNQLVNLYNQGQLAVVVEQATSLTEQYPEAFIVWNILGAANKGLNQVADASKAFRKVTELNPDYADGYNNLGFVLQDQGRFDEAIASYTKALALKPNHVDAYFNMGTALQDQGRLDEAIGAYKKALSLKPDYAEAYNNIGNAIQGQGMLDEAIETYKKALAIKPDFAEAYINMGNTLKDQGKLDEAIEALNKALSLNPDHAGAYNNMGNALQEKGKFDEAIASYTKALSLKPDYAEAYNNMGATFKNQGKLDEATEALNKALAIKPDYADAHNNMGNTLKDQGKLDEAIEALNKAIAIKPDYAGAHNNMGNALQEKDMLDAAFTSYTKALAIKPDYADAYNNMGNTLKDQGKLDEAVASYSKALSLKPDHAEAHHNMGAALQEQGKLDKAIEAYKEALAIKPDYAEAHRNLSLLIKYDSNHPQIAAVGEMMKRSDLTDDEGCHLHYAFAKMNEDIGRLDVAFESYVAGGRLRQKFLSYDPKQDELVFHQIKTTAPNIKDIVFKRPVEATSHTPIFILGMPRSGTTLVEQIISSHSHVFGAGELAHLNRLASSLHLGNQIINSDSIFQVRIAYLTELEKVSDGSPFVTDKMPNNFLYIDLILKALPEAKIIHVKRDPAATCWSNFKHYFAVKGLGYSYNLEDAIGYFKLYQNLMSFWDDLYGDQIYHFDYDRLTVDQGSETRKLIEYIELDWEDACLSPHENKRRVKTASQQQVREKVYTGSSDAWRKFEPYLSDSFQTFR